MRNAREQRGLEGIRALEFASTLGFLGELDAVKRHAGLGGERTQQPLLVEPARCAQAADEEQRPLVRGRGRERDERAGGVRQPYHSSRCAGLRRTLDLDRVEAHLVGVLVRAAGDGPFAVEAQHGGTSQVETARDGLAQRRQRRFWRRCPADRVADFEQNPRLRLARLGDLELPAEHRKHRGADARDREEHKESHDVLGASHRQRVHRRHEEEVEQQVGQQRGQQTGAIPPYGAHNQRQQQVQQCDVEEMSLAQQRSEQRSQATEREQ